MTILGIADIESGEELGRYQELSRAYHVRSARKDLVVTLPPKTIMASGQKQQQYLSFILTVGQIISSQIDSRSENIGLIDAYYLC